MAGAGKLAILVGGGPAPGINSVIGAATIRAVLEGVEVIGIRDGFDRIMHGASDAVIPLNIEKASRLHFRELLRLQLVGDALIADIMRELITRFTCIGHRSFDASQQFLLLCQQSSPVLLCVHECLRVRSRSSERR